MIEDNDRSNDKTLCQLTNYVPAIISWQLGGTDDDYHWEKEVEWCSKWYLEKYW